MAGTGGGGGPEIHLHFHFEGPIQVRSGSDIDELADAIMRRLELRGAFRDILRPVVA